MRIDRLAPDTLVRLRFVGRWGNETREEWARFLGIDGTGDERLAKFRSFYDGKPGGTYDWEAYRYSGRWAYGTSADPLQLVND